MMTSPESFFSKYKLEISLFVFCFVTRAFAAFHGAPYCYHNDEHWMFAPAFSMVAQGNWELDWFRIPPLLILIFRVALTGLQWVAPTDLNLPDWLDPHSVMPYQFGALYLGRLIVAFFGSAGVVMVFLILRQLTYRLWALFFSVLYSLVSVHIFYTSFLRPEPLVIFFLSACLFFLMRAEQARSASQVVENKSNRHWMWAGLFFGLACGSKYNAGFFVFSVLFFLLLGDSTWKSKTKHFLRFTLFSILGFVASFPYLFFRFPVIYRDFFGNYSTYKTGEAGNQAEPASNFLYYLYCLYSEGKFGPLFFVFVIALVLLPWVYKRLDHIGRRVFATSIFFCISYTVFLSSFPYYGERNLTFIYPFLVLTAALFCQVLMHEKDSWKKWTAKSLMLISLFWIGFESFNYIRKFNQPLPQDHVRSWIETNAKRKSFIVREIDSPLIDPSKYQVFYSFYAATIKPMSLLQLNPDYLILSHLVYLRRNEFVNDYPKQFSEWIWSKEPEFEDKNFSQIPLGLHFRIYDFQKLKSEFETLFAHNPKFQ